jgi:hypothetical protein
MDKNTFQMHDHKQQYSSIFEGQQKKIQCTRELVFNVAAKVMTEDDEGKDIACEEIVVKNFHIPVPENVEYKYFMDAFFTFLENCLSNSAQHAYNTPAPEKVNDE